MPFTCVSFPKNSAAEKNAFMKNAFLIIGILLLVFSCKKGDEPAKETWQPLDLLSNGLPISVLAPDSARVNVTSVGAVKDVTIIGPASTPYYVQIYVQPALTLDMAELKSNQINEVKTNPDFSRIVEEDENSFLYELGVDDSKHYSFRYVHLQADQEYVFTTGFTEKFTLEEAKRLYAAVKQ